MINIQKLTDMLPENVHPAVEAVANATVRRENPVRVCLVGAFSSGKSSLINMLLNQDILPAAREETTALPTFIEYDAAQSMSLIHGDETSYPVDAAAFRESTVNAPADVVCAVLKMPLEWLRGLTIIDLPGLGSISSAHREYTVAQLQLADVVLYLLPPRGPGRDDIETISLIRQYGKHLKIVVSQWDVVEASVRNGEKAPDLDQWSADVERKTGASVRICAVSKFGHGRQDVLDFLEKAQTDFAEIRDRRFRAEMTLTLKRVQAWNRSEQEACSATSELEIQTLHTRLLERKEALISLKSGLYEQQNQDFDNLDATAARSVEILRNSLNHDLLEFRAAYTDAAAHCDTPDEAWKAFTRKGTERLRTALAETASGFSDISTQYGGLKLPNTDIAVLDLKLPAPEHIDITDFLNTAKLKQLEETLQELQKRQETEIEKLRHLPAGSSEQYEQHEQQLMALKRHEQEVQAMQPSEIVRLVEGSGEGLKWFRALGSIGDIALMITCPVAAGAKIASIIGESAQIANIAVDTARVAGIASSGVKAVQALHMGGRLPSPIKSKLGILEMFSLGFWTEKLGAMLGFGPKYEICTDPKAQAEYDAITQKIAAQIKERQEKLDQIHAMMSEREFSDWALEQSRKEISRIKTEIEALHQKAQAAREDAQKEADRRHIELLRQPADRGISHWLRNFDQQTRIMQKMLGDRCKAYWQERVAQTLTDETQNVQELSERLASAPQEKEVVLARLKREAEQMQSAMALLEA